MTLVNHKYKLGSLIRGGEVSTFEAEDLLSGRPYYIHLLSGVGPSLAALEQSVRQRLSSGQGGPQAPVVEQGDHEGKTYVVTLAKPELLDLKRWLETQGAAVPPPPAAVPPRSTAPPQSASAPPPSAGANQPGEFTLLFQGGGDEPRTAQTVTDYQPPASPHRPASTPAWTSQPPAPASAPRQPEGSGEFTRVFGGSSPGSASSDDLFASPSPVAPPAAPPVRPTPVVSNPPREDSAPPPTRNPSPPPANSSFSGGFTRIFGEPQPSSPSPAPPGHSSPGSTGAFSFPPSDSDAPHPKEHPLPWETPAAFDPTPVVNKPPPPPPARNPGEFTKIFESGRPAAQPSFPGASSSGAFPRLDSAGPVPPPSPNDTTSSGLRKISPEERREEMRQFRMISRDGSTDFTKTRSSPAYVPPREPEPKSPQPPPAYQPPPAPPVYQAPPPPPPSAPPHQQTGEFTKLFRSGSPSASGQHSAPPPAAPPPASPQAPSAESWGQEPNRVHETGEFTKLFRGGQPGSPGPYPASQQPAPPPPSSGEFTRQFSSGFGGSSANSDPWSQPPASPPPQQKRPSGEFTRIFGGSGQSSGGPGPNAPVENLFNSESNWPAETSQPLTQPDQQGDFTKLFGKSGPGGNQEWTGPQYAAPSGATQISREPSYQAPPSAPVQPAPPSSDGPGEFTRIMGGAPPLPRQQAGQAPPPPQYAPPQGYQPPGYPPMQPPAPAPPAAAPAAQAAPAPPREERAESNNRSMYLILALVFCGLLVAALAIVLFVVLTRPSEPAASTAPAAAQAPAPVGSSGAFARPQLPSASAPSVPSVTPPSVTAPSVSAPSVSAPTLPSAQLPAGVQLPAAQAPAAAPASSTPFLALIIVLSVLLVVAIGAAVFFALRR